MNIAYHGKELADLYALGTLHAYLQPRVEATHGFSSMLASINTPRAQAIRRDAATMCLDHAVDLAITPLSDIHNKADVGNFNLGIDISILKNCAPAMTAEEKADLRKKYNVTTDKPVMVIGFACYYREIQKIVKEFHKKAEIYLVGDIHDFKRFARHIPVQAYANIHNVTEHGVLKDYYAMADVAINGRNLTKHSGFMHNFIEATEGGPLFLVPPYRTDQYGYRELVQAGVIKECNNLKDLIKKVHAYLKQGPNKDHEEKRSGHIAATRERYLPVIESYLRRMIGEPVSLPSSDLTITEGERRIHINHPDTSWSSRKAITNALEVATATKFSLMEIAQIITHIGAEFIDEIICKIHEKYTGPQKVITIDASQYNNTFSEQCKKFLG